MNDQNQTTGASKVIQSATEEQRFQEKLAVDVGSQMFAELGKVKDSPRLLVLVAHGFLELMVNAVIDAKLKHGAKITSDNRGFPHSTRLLLLNEVGILSDSTFRLYDWFRKLRNKAAHEPLFEVTAKDLEILPEQHREPDKLHSAMLLLLAAFWNAHLNILLPRFMPTLADRASNVGSPL